MTGKAARIHATLLIVLSKFTVAGHPGIPSHRTGWISDEQLALWRTAFDDSPADADPSVLAQQLRELAAEAEADSSLGSTTGYVAFALRGKELADALRTAADGVATLTGQRDFAVDQYRACAATVAATQALLELTPSMVHPLMRKPVDVVYADDIRKVLGNRDPMAVIEQAVEEWWRKAKRRNPDDLIDHIRSALKRGTL